jgi:hypothetical protein
MNHKDAVADAAFLPPVHTAPGGDSGAHLFLKRRTRESPRVIAWGLLASEQ